MNDEESFLVKLRKEFLQEAYDLIDNCEEAFLGLDDPECRDEMLALIFRAVHTIKGSGAAVGFVDLVEFAHEVEDCLAALRTYPEKLTTELTSLLLSCMDALREKINILTAESNEHFPTEALGERLREFRSMLIHSAKGESNEANVAFGFFEDTIVEEASSQLPTSKENSSEILSSIDKGRAPRKETTSVKVDGQRIDSVLDLVGELVVIKSQLINQIENYSHDVPLVAVVSLLDKTVRELQDRALAIRMMPVKPLFIKMQRMARDLAIKVNKSLVFEMEGEETELDRMVVEALGDPLLHLIRNAIDHGLECPEMRRSRGKDPQGHVRLSASQVGGRVIVCIKDDGRGINREKVIGKAVERKILESEVHGQKLSEQEVFALLLAPGFSTAEAVTDLSGRGVGLDVVKTHIEKLKGTLVIRSEEGQGSTFEISLPLTASVTDGMIVNVDGQTLVLPMDRIRELVSVNPQHIVEVSQGQSVLNVRGQMYPLIDSSALFARKGENPREFSSGLAVVFGHQDRMYALSITSVIGQMQVIMKPMCCGLTQELVSGVTILGDGQVALVADIDGVVHAHLRALDSQAAYA